MFKKMLTVCAGLTLTSHAAIAQLNPLGANNLLPTSPAIQQPAPANAVSTFIGETNGLPLVVQFTSQNGSVAGRIIVGDKMFSLAGRDQNGYIEGTWGAQSTQRFPFQATTQGGQMKLTTNGQTFALNQNGQDQTTDRRPAPVGFDVAGVRPTTPANPNPGADLSQVELSRGQFFNTPVIRGWKVYDAQNNVVVVSPDGKSAYGIIGMPLNQPATPEQFLRQTFAGFGVKDLQILSSQNLQSQNGQDAMDAVVSFTGADGTPRKGLVRAAVMSGNGQSFGFFQHAAAPVDKFEDVRTLSTLASQIRMANPPQPTPAVDRIRNQENEPYINRYEDLDRRGSNQANDWQR